jgi:hypothetical protein
VRIDRSDVADGLGTTYVASVRSAPDDPDAAGKDQGKKDQGKALGGDSPPDSSLASVDSALRIKRTESYHAAVDSAYQQDAIDHGHARVENLRVPGGTTQHDGRTTAECMLTGARGLASGREFDPETAGGPIQQLDAGEARITNEGVQEATAHLQRFTGGGPLEAPERAMLDRLTSIAAGDMKPTSYDLNFYTHELDEADRYAKLGFGPESGVDLGSPEMYDVWNDVHTAALEDYGVSGADLFYPEVRP